MLTWETKWLRGTPATPNPPVTKPENHDVGTAPDIEDHVLTGHATFRSWCAACVQSARSIRETPGRRSQGAGRWLEDPSRLVGLLLLGARNRISEAEVEQRGDSPVLVMHDGVTKSIFPRLIPAKGVDFPAVRKWSRRWLKIWTIWDTTGVSV